MEIGLLGSLKVTVDGTERVLARRKQRVALAVLSLHSGELVTVDRLVDALWGQQAPPTAANALQGHISAIRKMLGPSRIETQPAGYLLRLEEGELDITRFEFLLGQARAATDPEGRAGCASEALALFRGEPLADFHYDEFAAAEIARLAELRLAGTEEHVQAQLELGRHAEVVADLREFAKLNPLRERLHAQLMLALYRSGRQAEALACYQDIRRTLREELGLTPSSDLQRLQRAILIQDPALASGAVMRLRHIPAEIDSFVGRTVELARLADLALKSAVRLVTVTGPGGSGKTRLALRALHALPTDRFPDGIYFVDLSPLAQSGLVLAAIAEAVGVPDTGLPFAETLAARISNKRILLLLDNFEHVIDDALAVAQLLAACPELRIIATSRVPLRLRGEHQLEVEPLDATAAIQLFLDRGNASGARLATTAAGLDSKTVAEICQRLDGLPLAIELAAARTRELTPGEILARLDHRLDLLSDGAADLPRRQQTLRAAIGWSYDLLEEREQRMFRRLAVFHGGCVLSAAENVCGLGAETLDALIHLIDHRLVQERPASGGEPRFAMLETVREFAREQATAARELDDLEERYAAFFISLAEELGPSMRRIEEEVQPAFVRLSAELDNFRGVYAWALTHDRAAPGLHILGEIWLWSWSRLGETLDWIERLLALPSAASSEYRPEALFVATIVSWALGDLGRVRAYGEECVAACEATGDRENLPLALALLMSTHVDDVQEGRRLYAAARHAATLSRDGWNTAFVDVCLGFYSVLRNEGEAATEAGSNAANRFRALGASRHVLLAQLPIGFGRLQTGDLAGARDALEPALAEFARIENWKMAAMAAIGSGMAARFGDDNRAARNLYERGLAICEEAGDPSNLPLCLEGMAATTVDDDAYEAVRLLRAADVAFSAGRTPTLPGFEVFFEQTRDELRARLGDAFDPLFGEE